MHEDDTTRNRILGSTVKLLFTTAPDGLTTRRIAGEAGVNVAAINYHFRSKDELMDLALQAATAEAFEKGLAILLAPGVPENRLRDYLKGYAAGLVRFPGLTVTAYRALFSSDGRGTFYGSYLTKMLDAIGSVIAEIDVGAGGPPAANTPAEQALMVVSAVVFPFLVTNAARSATVVDYGNDEARGRYIENVLTLVVGRK